MNRKLWKISRYWNRIAFSLINLGRLMIWDQTKLNGDLLKNLVDETTEEILTDRLK